MLVQKVESSSEKKSAASSNQAISEPKLAKQSTNLFDVAFVLDCTSSMQEFIDIAIGSIKQIVLDLANEKNDIKLALVEYKDHEKLHQCTKIHDFTGSIKKMNKWLNKCSAKGGCETPEALADGLDEALKLNWREKSTKICALITDAPPHGLTRSVYDKFPQGCPNGIDPIDVVQKMSEKGIVLYSVGCEPTILSYKSHFVDISHKTGGQYVPLKFAKHLSKVFLGADLEELLIIDDSQLDGEELRIKEVTYQKSMSKDVDGRIKSGGATAFQMRINNLELKKSSKDALNCSSTDVHRQTSQRKNTKVNLNTIIDLTTFKMKFNDSELEVSINAVDYSFTSTMKYILTTQSVQKTKKPKFQMKLNDSQLEISINSVNYLFQAKMIYIRPSLKDSHESVSIHTKHARSSALQMILDDSKLEVRTDASKKSFITTLKYIGPAKRVSSKNQTRTQGTALQMRLNNSVLEINTDSLKKSFITTLKHIGSTKSL